MLPFCMFFLPFLKAEVVFHRHLFVFPATRRWITRPPPPLPSVTSSRAAPLRLLPPRPPLEVFQPLTAATGGCKSRHPYRRKRHCGRCRRSATAGRSRGDGGARGRRRGGEAAATAEKRVLNGRARRSRRGARRRGRWGNTAWSGGRGGGDGGQGGGDEEQGGGDSAATRLRRVVEAAATEGTG